MGQSAYRRIADAIRDKIVSGDLSDGDRLPSEAELCRIHGVSTATVRGALRELRSEGLVSSAQGRGVFVRRPARAVRVAPWRYWEHPDAAWLREAETAGQEVTHEHRTVRVQADAAVADRLGIDVGNDVVTTAYLFRLNGQPVITSRAWEPAVVVGGTEVEDPHAGRWADTGVVPRMEAIGHRPTDVHEDLEVRMPTPDEARTLDMPEGVPVVVMEQVFYCRLTAVEAARIITRGDRYRWAYRMEIPPNGRPS